MHRRRFVTLAGGLWLLLTGHSPYRQWEVYRKVRLVVVVDAGDAAAVRLGQAIAEVLAKHLPESRAMLARARDVGDLVRLLASRQLDTAVLREDDAWTAVRGAGRFADNGNVPLRTLAQIEQYVFVCRDDMPNANAYQLAETLAERWPKPVAPARVPIHPGAKEYYEDHRPQHGAPAGAAIPPRAPN